jgi:flagellar FliL protein
MPEESPQQPEQKKDSRKGLMVAAGVLVVLLAAGGGAVYFMMHRGNPTAENLQNPDTPGAGKEPQSWNLGSLVVNLAPPDDQTYLKVELAFGYHSSQDAQVSAELEKRRDQLIDIVNMALSSKKYGEINNVHGKTQLKQELIRLVNEVLSSGQIEEIYFRAFTFQET